MSLLSGKVGSNKASGGTGRGHRAQSYYFNVFATSEHVDCYNWLVSVAYGKGNGRKNLPKGGQEVILLRWFETTAGEPVTLEGFHAECVAPHGMDGNSHIWRIAAPDGGHFVSKSVQDTVKVANHYLWLFELAGLILTRPATEDDAIVPQYSADYVRELRKKR